MLKQSKPLSASCLKSLDRSPEHCWENHLNPDRVRTSSPAMMLGSLVHCMALEPQEVVKRYAPMPEGMTRRGKVYQEWLSEQDGKDVVSYNDYMLAVKLLYKIYHLDILPSVPEEADRTKWGFESKIYWREQVGPHRPEMIGILDAIDYESKIVYDIKTTNNADDLGKVAANGRWDLQAVQYMEGANAMHGPSFRVKFIVVETNSPFRIRVVELDPVAMMNGKQSRQRLIQEFVERLENNDWTGEVESDVKLPNWFNATERNKNEIF